MTSREKILLWTPWKCFLDSKGQSVCFQGWWKSPWTCPAGWCGSEPHLMVCYFTGCNPSVLRIRAGSTISLTRTISYWKLIGWCLVAYGLASGSTSSFWDCNRMSQCLWGFGISLPPECSLCSKWTVSKTVWNSKAHPIDWALGAYNADFLMCCPQALPASSKQKLK